MSYDFIIRILAAAVIGGVIGLEREYRAKEAGFRTHFLVALGSALFMVVSQFGFEQTDGGTGHVSLDPSRVASQVVTGIGFIGAGIIIFQKHAVRGLTTAAGLWVTSAIGLACGSGLYFLAFITMILVLICLEVLYFIVRCVESKHISVTFSSLSKDMVTEIIDTLKNEGLEVKSYHIKHSYDDNATHYKMNVDINVRRNNFENIIKKILTDFDGVSIDEIE